MIGRSERYWARFPADRDRFRRLADAADAGHLRLPDGQRVGVERLRRLGHLLGASQGAERLHQLLDLDPAAPAFAHDLAAGLPFGGRNTLSAVMHECWGAEGVATRWAADRTMPDAVREDPTLLAGEHIRRDLFAEDPELEIWAEAADLLAEHEWPALYDEAALRAADVPGAAAVYYDDAYVPREFSMATAALLPRLRTWVTSEYEHNGLRASGETVLDHLLDLAAGRRAAWAPAAPPEPPRHVGRCPASVAPRPSIPPIPFASVRYRGNGSACRRQAGPSGVDREAEALVAARVLGGGGGAGGHPVAVAVRVVAQVGAAAHHAHVPRERVRPAGGPRVAAPLPVVPGHLVEAEAVGREGAHRRGAEVAVLEGVAHRERALPDVAAVLTARR